jgi:hypothetical protein
VFVTTDDYSKPLQKIRTKYLKIVPEEYLESYNTYLYAGDVLCSIFHITDEDLENI